MKTSKACERLIKRLIKDVDSNEYFNDVNKKAIKAIKTLESFQRILKRQERFLKEL